MSSDPRVTSIADAQAGAVATSQLLDAGIDRSWIRRRFDSGRWQRLHPGVFAVYSGPLTWRTRAYAALLHTGPGATLSHETAAFLLDFRTEAPRTLTVSVPEDRRITDRPGLLIVRRRAMPPSGGRPRRTWRGDTVVDLVAAARSDDDAVGWVCDAMRAGARLPEITDALARRARVRNRRLLEELLAEVAAGIESPLERRYHRDVERRHGLPRAELQVREVMGGVWIRADCVYRGLGVRVELDGALAHPTAGPTPTRGGTTPSSWPAARSPSGTAGATSPSRRARQQRRWRQRSRPAGGPGVRAGAPRGVDSPDARPHAPFPTREQPSERPRDLSGEVRREPGAGSRSFSATDHPGRRPVRPT